MTPAERKEIVNKILKEWKSAYKAFYNLYFRVYSAPYYPIIRVPLFSFRNSCGDLFFLLPEEFLNKKLDDLTQQNLPPLRKWNGNFIIKNKKSDRHIPFYCASNTRYDLPYLLRCDSRTLTSVDTLINEGFPPVNAHCLLQFLRRIRKWSENRLQGLDRVQMDLDKQQKKYSAPILAEITMEKLEKL